MTFGANNDGSGWNSSDSELYKANKKLIETEQRLAIAVKALTTIGLTDGDCRWHEGLAHRTLLLINPPKDTK
jgi:hypothetical protein